MKFEHGVLDEPLLTFGNQRSHVDPKAGLELYGPYSPTDETLHGRTILVGIVGPADVLALGQRWLHACQDKLSNDGRNPFQSPGFPGFNADASFRSIIQTGKSLQVSFRAIELERALGATAGASRIASISNLYVESIRMLAERDRRPDVVLCCISDEIFEKCLVGLSEKIRLRRSMSKGRRKDETQIPLFANKSDENEVSLDLWKAIKAGAMQHGVPTQLFREASLSLQESRETQDLATRAWNFSVALYHKAGGSPWRLANIDPDVCFAGISFFHDLRSGLGRMQTSVAQAFTSTGDGYVLRGEPFVWNGDREHERSPHMDAGTAANLVRDIIAQYRSQHHGQTPGRLVLHKSSLFWDEEIRGIRDAAADVPAIDLVALRGRGLQLFREGNYPPLRGTYVRFGETDMLLYTRGYIPYFATYPGPRTPQPIEIAQHFGDSPWTTVLTEILALTKMNWNSADFSAGEPITLSFSRTVGALLAELRPDQVLRPEYRYYM